MTSPAPARPQRATRADFSHYVPITLRWHDNDAYGHVNNVVYYAYFDTAVNQLLIEAGALDIETSTHIGLVVETKCTYHASLTYPGKIEVGVATRKIGNSSVQYHLGIFADGVDEAAAQGDFTHVYVERATQKPAPIPAHVRMFLESLAR